MKKGALVLFMTVLAWLSGFADAYSDLLGAINKSDKKAVKSALKAGADINRKNEKGEYPLQIAIVKAKPKIVKLLLKNKANPTLFPDILKTVIENDRKKVLKVLLKKGVNPNAPFNDGVLPLGLAVVLNNEKAVKILLQNGADPALKDKSGNSAVELAKKGRNMKIIKALSEKPKKK